MPYDNKFRHQRYDIEPPGNSYELRTPGDPIPVDSDRFSVEMAAAGQALRRLRIGMIVLVHGTFTGNDLTGLIRMIERMAPNLAHRLAEQEKRLADSLIGDLGNFSESFTNTLMREINRDAQPLIQVKRFQWSSCRMTTPVGRTPPFDCFCASSSGDSPTVHGPCCGRTATAVMWPHC